MLRSRGSAAGHQRIAGGGGVDVGFALDLGEIQRQPPRGLGLVHAGGDQHAFPWPRPATTIRPSPSVRTRSIRAPRIASAGADWASASPPPPVARSRFGAITNGPASPTIRRASGRRRRFPDGELRRVPSGRQFALQPRRPSAGTPGRTSPSIRPSERARNCTLAFAIGPPAAGLRGRGQWSDRPPPSKLLMPPRYQTTLRQVAWRPSAPGSRIWYGHRARRLVVAEGDDLGQTGRAPPPPARR